MLTIYDIITPEKILLKEGTIMETNNKEFDFNQRCSVIGKKIKSLALKLHQDLEGTIVGDDPYAWYVPYENQEEARRRVDFAYEMLKKYRSYMNPRSQQPVRNLFGYLNRRLRKIDEQLPGIRVEQMMFDFMEQDKEKKQKELRQERKDILEFKHLVLNPASYFEAVHYVEKASP